MTSIRDLARAKLAQLEAGHGAGRLAGQQVSHTHALLPPLWDTANPQESAENGQVSHCPTPIGTGRRDTPPESGTTGGTTNGTAGTISEHLAAARLREWRARLSKIDQFSPPSDFTLGGWLDLTDTAFWLYESHGAYAVRNGWSAHDLFGVRVGMPNLGGLADLLDGARNLKLDGGKAHWTHLGVHCRMNIGCGDGCTLLWELG